MHTNYEIDEISRCAAQLASILSQADGGHARRAAVDDDLAVTPTILETASKALILIIRIAYSPDC